MRDAIDAWFDTHRNELIADVGHLIAVDSVRGEARSGMPYGPGPAAALKTVSDILTGKGLTPVNAHNRVVTADLNDCEPALGILAHVDTVAAGDGWTSDPLKAVVRDGKLYGRGATDDKGPAVAAVYALAAAKKLAPGLTKGCRLLLGAAEETGHDDLAHYRQHHTLPPCVFTPDGYYPVVNSEKGRFCATFTAGWQHDGALPRIVSVTGGRTANAVPEHAQAVVEGLPYEDVNALCRIHSEKTNAVLNAETLDGLNGLVRITSKGMAAHASQPETGLNAQTALLALLGALPMADSAAYVAVKKLNALFPHGDTAGEALGIAMADDIAGPLTLNFGVLSVDASGLTAGVDSRTPACATTENMDDVVISKMTEAGFKIKEIVKTPFHHTPADWAFVRTLMDVYEAYTGLTAECLTMGGQTYVHDIDGGVAFGSVFPGEDPRMHGADEFIAVDDLILSAKMFTQAIIRLCR